MTGSKIFALIEKEAILELRRKYALLGILLFTATLVYLIYKSFNVLQGLNWAVMLWIVALFSGINAVAKSFTQDADGSAIYYYTLFTPQEVIVAKLIYNFLFVLLLIVLTYLGFSVLLDNQIKDLSLFTISVLGGSYGIATIYTFIAMVSSQSSQNNAVLMSVLSIPLSIPILLLLIKCTAVAMRLLQDSSVYKDVTMILGIDLLLTGCVFLLFAELWRD
jgi:heme exporter protein B